MRHRWTAIVVLLLGLALSLDGDVAGAGGRAPDTVLSAWQPRNMELAGQIGGPARTVALQGNYAYLGIGPRLAVLDVTDPTQPAVVGLSEEMPDYVQDVAVSGDRAYVVWNGGGRAFTSGLRVLDVSDRAQPRTISRYPMPGRRVNRIHLDGDYVYVAAGGLQVIDISNPTALQEVGVYDPPGGVMDVYVVGGYAYIAVWGVEYNPPTPGGSGLRVVDVSDPTTPREVGFFPTSEGADAVYVAGDVAYLGDEEGVWVVDVSNPTDPQPMSRYPVSGGVRGAIQVVGDYAYLATWFRGLHILDVSDPSAPVQVGIQSTPGFEVDVDVADGYVYVASFGALSIIDVSDPERPVSAGVYDVPNHPIDVDAVGDLAYVADDTGWTRIGRRLLIIDVSNPVVPMELSSYQLDDEVYHVSVSGHHAYVVTSSGIDILNVSDPTAPYEVGLYDAEGNERDVHVARKYAYVVATIYEGDDIRSRLEVVGIADPMSPTRVGVYEFPREAGDVFVANDIAYIVSKMCAPMPGGGTDCFGVVRLVDVTTPEAPKELAVYTPPGSAGNVFVTGDSAYVADDRAGLRIVDVSDPTQPREIGSSAPLPAVTVHVSGDYAYVGTDRRGSHDYSGVHVFDVSNHGAPVEVGSYLMRGVPFGIDVAGGYAYAAADQAGLMILRLTPPDLWRMFLPLLQYSGSLHSE